MVLHYRDEDGYMKFRRPLMYNGAPGAFNIRHSKSNDVIATPNNNVIKHHPFCDRLSKFSIPK